MGTWHFWPFLLENPHAHKIPRFLGGGGSAGVGVEVPFYFFYGLGDSSEIAKGFKGDAFRET